MIDKPIDEIAVEDLQRLQTNGVPESRSLEYKQALPGGTDEERKEFLADVSALANTAGGDLIYGVTEARENGKPTGVPERISGLSVVSPDAERLRLENMLRDGIAPRLPGVQLRWLNGFPDGSVLLIRVPRSWAGPHMVTFKQHSRFYARNSGGKYVLDVFELRQAFLGSGSLADRAREFRAERLGRISAGDGPVPLAGNSALICVHIIPHAALAGGVDIDLHLASKQGDNLTPLYVHDRSRKFNLDGFLAFDTDRETGRSMSYLQLFRSGAIETAITAMVTQGDRQRFLPALTFEKELHAFLGRAKRLMQAIGVEPPASLFLPFIGMRGVALGLSQQLTFYRDIHAMPFDRDNLLFRDLLLVDWDAGDPRALLKPLLDEVWQAAGLPRCLDYDEQGNWEPLR